MLSECPNFVLVEVEVIDLDLIEVRVLHQLVPCMRELICELGIQGLNLTVITAVETCFIGSRKYFIAEKLVAIIDARGGHQLEHASDEFALFEVVILVQINSLEQSEALTKGQIYVEGTKTDNKMFAPHLASVRYVKELESITGCMECELEFVLHLLCKFLPRSIIPRSLFNCSLVIAIREKVLDGGWILSIVFPSFNWLRLIPEFLQLHLKELF